MIEPQWRIVVLRLEHRPERDKRLTSHLGLTARALGAMEFWVGGLRDSKIHEAIQKVSSQWGQQTFIVETGVAWKKRMKSWRKSGGEIIHLTMYGIHVDDALESIRASPRDKLIIVGGPKVPSEIFKMADFNVAIGHQPHSEVAALAIFLDRLHQGRNLHTQAKDAKLRIIPCANGKRVKPLKGPP